MLRSLIKKLKGLGNSNNDRIDPALRQKTSWNFFKFFIENNHYPLARFYRNTLLGNLTDFFEFIIGNHYESKKPLHHGVLDLLIFPLISNQLIRHSVKHPPLIRMIPFIIGILLESIRLLIGLGLTAGFSPLLSLAHIMTRPKARRLKSTLQELPKHTEIFNIEIEATHLLNNPANQKQIKVTMPFPPYVSVSEKQQYTEKQKLGIQAILELNLCQITETLAIQNKTTDDIIDYIYNEPKREILLTEAFNPRNQPSALTGFINNSIFDPKLINIIMKQAGMNNNHVAVSSKPLSNS